MPFQPTPQAIRVKLLMSQNDVKMENVWNVDYGAAVTPVGLSLVSGIINSWVTTYYAPLMNSSVHFDQIICTDISVANGAQDIRIPTTLAGTNVGVQSGGNVAFVASLRTLHTGKNFRGRTYIPGVPQTYLTDAQHVSVSYAGVVNAAFNQLLAALVGGGYKLCVLSRYLNKIIRTVGLLTEVISIVTDTKIDSQQRRTAN